MIADELGQRDLENHDAVAFVLRDCHGRVLTLYHAKFGFWTVPLGKVEVGQSPEEAVAAEALEECGITVLRMQRTCTGTRVYHHPNARVVTFFHVFEILEFDGAPINREPDKHLDMRFMSVSDLQGLEATSDGTELWLDHLAARGPDDLSRPGLAGSPLPSGARISLSGAAGAGKTTFARYLRDHCGATVHPESVRTWLAAHGGLEYPSLSDAQYARLQLDLLDRYEASEANVFDRSPLDSLVYVRRVSRLVDLDVFQARAGAFLKTFRSIVLFPPHAHYLKVDGVRIVDLGHQMDMAAEIHFEARRLGLGALMTVYDHSKSMRANADAVAVRCRVSAAPDRTSTSDLP